MECGTLVVARKFQINLLKQADKSTEEELPSEDEENINNE
jgi:hypothetical protein